MKTATLRRTSVALAVLTLAAAATSVHAAPGHRKAARKPAQAGASAAQMTRLLEEVRGLRTSLAEETAARMRLQAQIEHADTVVQATQAAQTRSEAALAAQAGADAAAIQTLPSVVAQEVAKAKPKTDGLYFKGVKITPGGFLEAAAVYRQHNLGNDVSTALNSIPFPQTRTGHLSEYRFTPRQSRVSALVEGQPTPDLTLSMYGEFDFQGAAQTANSNETNSFNPRIRHLYGAIDWTDIGVHFLAGQTFSLVTLDSKGITPRNEVVPLTIDGQYSVGFTWTRQPEIRVVKDMFDKHLWLAVSAENPQTTFSGTVPAGVINTINNGQGFYAGETNTGVAATQSVNHVPDFVAKAAIEEELGGHHVHLEVLGLARSFYEQLATFKTNDVTTAAVGAGFTAQLIPGLLDVQASGLTGKGIGRCGSGQLPDVTFNTTGRIEPIHETIALVGGALHVTKSLDLWAFGGE